MNARQQILTFKVQLRDIKPAIWRRIEVPASYTFWDLHVAIQDAMGWLDSHLHAFQVRDPRTRAEATIGIPDPDPFEGAPDFLPGWRVHVTAYLAEVGQRARYDYDFGDGWEHDLLLEQIGMRQAKAKYPRCVAGARACPPEDCGGPGGYAQLLKTIANPADPEHQSMLKWLGGPFAANAFDAHEVHFDNPKKRRQVAFAEG
ncbi:MAG: plasmid pRiA4b ORF-3 family protein [Gemmatimonadales bacterium]|nr:plasmid pRiA4b ORF-3 family protein [Gemmatimonadales bacterium]